MSFDPTSSVLPSDAPADALAVVRRLRDSGYVAYFAGGCVRDSLMGNVPKDYDVATDAPPDRVRQLFPRTQAVGAAFGVILVRQGKSVIEVATFRTDGVYADGRRPTEVRFTTAEEDAKRRDFTINGLFLDPLENDRVIDFVGGVDDLRKKVLRAIGNPAERFAEDHLRVLRAVRFAARLGFEIESDTASAIKRDAELLVRISPERIADELRRMLQPTSQLAAWTLLWEVGLTPVIFRLLPGVQFVGPEPSRSLFAYLGTNESIPFGLALATAVVCIENQSAKTPARFLDKKGIVQVGVALRQSLKISNDEWEECRGCLEGVRIMTEDLGLDMTARLKRFLARPTASLSRTLAIALATSTGYSAERTRLTEVKLTELEQTDFAPAPLLTGDDLTAAGFTPAPSFKAVLDSTYDKQLEGAIQTKEQAMKFAQDLI